MVPEAKAVRDELKRNDVTVSLEPNTSDLTADQKKDVDFKKPEVKTPANKKTVANKTTPTKETPKVTPKPTKPAATDSKNSKAEVPEI